MADEVYGSVAGEEAVEERMDVEETVAMAVDPEEGDEDAVKMDAEEDDSNDESLEESDGSFEDSDEEDSDDSDDDEGEDSDGDEGEQEDRQMRTNARVNVNDIKMHLTCHMCSGYFRDAHTVVECLHTFCKSCIMIHFKKGERSCPYCHRELSSANPEMMLRFDHTMQCLVDKIFPDIQTADREREEAFYASRNIKRKAGTRAATDVEKNISKERDGENALDAPGAKAKSPLKAERGTPAKATTMVGVASKTSNMDEKREDSETRAPGAAKTKSKEGSSTRLGAEVDFKLVANRDCPEDLQLAMLPKPFLRTSNKLKVSHLKKFLSKKMEGVSSKEIELSVEGIDLESQHTLAAIISDILKDTSKTLAIAYRRRVTAT